MDHDEDILYAVIGAFIQEVPALIAQLLDALQNRDETSAKRASHTLNGNFRILQLQSQQTCWAKIESLAHEGDFDQITSLLPEAKRVTEEVLSQLQAKLDTYES